MTRVTLYPYWQTPVVRDLVPGWNRLGSDIGAWLYPRNDANPSAPRGVQFRCARGGWYRIEVDDAYAPTWRGEGYLPPRAILTVRPDSPAPTNGLLRFIGAASDFSGGGGQGIDACGTPGTVHDHDATMQRTPVGLFDMATGKLRAAKSIPVAGYYRATRGYPYNKVTQPPEFVVKLTADQYDDRRDAADATSIPADGAALRAQVLSWQAFDGQHLIRAYRFALLLLGDPIVQDDVRALCRDAELAWDDAREAAILASPGGRGHADVGREWAWASYLAAIVERMDSRFTQTVRNLFGLGFASKMRRIARHVAHRDTGILQRFVEGMSASPYPFGPYPASGVPIGQKIGLTQHLEACAQIVALDALGLKRETLTLCETILPTPGLKWWNTDTGQPIGGSWHGPAEDQAWPALAIYMRLDRARGLAAAKRHKVPDRAGAWNGPYSDRDQLLVGLRLSEPGKASWAIKELVA